MGDIHDALGHLSRALESLRVAREALPDSAGPQLHLVLNASFGDASRSHTLLESVRDELQR